MDAKNAVLTATITSAHPNRWIVTLDYDAEFVLTGSKAEVPGTFHDWFTLLPDSDTRYGMWQEPPIMHMPQSGHIHRSLTHTFDDPAPALFSDLHQAVLWMQNTGGGLQPESKAVLTLAFEK